MKNKDTDTNISTNGIIYDYYSAPYGNEAQISVDIVNKVIVINSKISIDDLFKLLNIFKEYSDGEWFVKSNPPYTISTY